MPEKVSAAEAELGRTASLVGEIVDARAEGNRNPVRGNSDEDLLGAVEELEDAIRGWRSDVVDTSIEPEPFGYPSPIEEGDR